MRDSKLYTILDAATATGVGNIINVSDFRHLVVTVNTSGSANLTVKAQGAIANDAPNFAAAQSPANAWDFIQMKDLEDGSSIDGDTGLVLAGTDDQRIFEINVNGLEWFTFRVTAISAGAITIVGRVFEN